jgi:hypothetical protein
MRILFILFAFIIVSCNDQQDQTATTDTTATQQKVDTPLKKKKLTKPLEIELDTTVVPKEKVYANKRFKDVKVESLGSNKFRITGNAQVFEASFNWKVEDGHDQLLSGYTTTDAGAPEFGKFNFTITVRKRRPNSTLTLTLYEASANDGSPQHELHIPLPTD